MGKGIVVEKGQRFGRLVVVPESSPKNKRRRVEVLCDCTEKEKVRKTKIVRLSGLREGSTKSCGCLHREFAASGRSARKHGEAKKTTLYARWASMIFRCKENYKQNKDYYHRGIRICDEWAESYEEFRDWALNNGFSKELELDRVDNNRNYEPNNCHWISQEGQKRNQQKSCWWWIKGVRYASCYLAGAALSVSHVTIFNWCNDPNRPDCYKIKKYPDAI